MLGIQGSLKPRGGRSAILGMTELLCYFLFSGQLYWCFWITVGVSVKLSKDSLWSWVGQKPHTHTQTLSYVCTFMEEYLLLINEWSTDICLLTWIYCHHNPLALTRQTWEVVDFFDSSSQRSLQHPLSWHLYYTQKKSGFETSLRL